MKKILTISALSSLLLWSACSKDNSTSTAATIPPEPIVEAPCIAYLQFASPKLFFQKVDGVLETLGMKAMAPMFLSQYGYPEFSEFDAALPITLFVKKNPADPAKPIIFALAKLQEEGPLTQAAASMPVKINPLDQGWSIISLPDLDASQINNLSDLQVMASTIPANAFEGKVYAQSALEYREAFLQNIRDGLTVQEYNNPEINIELLAEKLFGELDQIKHIAFTADFSGKTISYTTTLDSRTGTPLGNALQAAQEKTISEQLFIPDDFAIQSIYNLNTPAITTYLAHLKSLLSPVFTGMSGEEFTKASDQVIAFIDSSEGTNAVGQIRNNSFDSVYVAQTKSSNEDIKTQLTELTDLTNKLLAQLNPELKDKESFILKTDVESYQGSQIHSFVNEMYEAGGISSIDELSHTYITIKDGYAISSYNLVTLKSTLDAIDQGKGSIENSMSLSLTANQASISKIDIVDYLAVIYKMMEEFSSNAKTAAIIEQLQAQDIPPAITSLIINNSDATVSLDMPIEKLIQALLPLAMSMK